MERRKWFYGLLILLSVVMIGLFLLVWQAGISRYGSAGASQSPPQLSQSAADAATVLQTWLPDNWAADGVIVACTLTLVKRAPTENNWTFQVYSAQKNRLLVAVVRDQDVQVLRDVAALYQQSGLPAEAWKWESKDILAVWWRSGGATAWNDAAASTVVLHLRMREDGIPSWQLTLEKAHASVLEYWEIRADTGMLLEHSSTGGR